MANQCFDQKQESLEPEQEPSDKNELFHWILTLAIAVIIALCVNRFVLVNAEIPSGSMENTIMTGDRVSETGLLIYSANRNGSISLSSDTRMTKSSFLLNASSDFPVKQWKSMTDRSSSTARKPLLKM